MKLIISDDMTRAISFYEKPILIKDDIYSVFDINDFRLGLFAYLKLSDNHNCIPSIEVESLAVLKRKIIGLEICFPLTQIGPNCVVESVDSEGNYIELTTLL